MKTETCVLCGRVLPASASGDPKAASVEHCSPYDFDMDTLNGVPGASKSYTEKQRRAHRAWLNGPEGQKLQKAERTARRVHGEVKEARIDAYGSVDA